MHINQPRQLYWMLVWLMRDTYPGTSLCLPAFCVRSGDVELVSTPGGSLISIGGIGNTSNPAVQASSSLRLRGPL